MRSLLLVSLLVLCTMCLSGAAMAADGMTVTGQDIPAVMTWEQVDGVTVNTTNSGTTTWDTTYDLASVMGVTAAATAINRWGIPDVAVVGTVAPAAAYDFDFNIMAPPITTLTYNLATSTTVGVIAGFDNNWMLSNAGTLVTTDTAAQATTIDRFPDIVPGLPDPRSYVNAFQIEELAGRVPVVVTGYPDGTYRPIANVTRTAMAVYMQRAMELPLGAYADEFTDIATDYINAGQIQACVDAGIVQGFPDGTYRPTVVVNRGQMATYVARGLAGGDDFVPTPTVTPTFTDVPNTHPQWKYVEYTVDAGVVQGFPDGTYRPTAAVNRGAMAVYMYRAFLQNQGSIVVVAGPSVTALDTDAVSYDGWSETNVAADETNPGVDAYVGFDGMRFSDAQADFDVDFELYLASNISPTGVPLAAPTATGTVTVDVSAAHADALIDGNPYEYAKWDIPAVAPGVYVVRTIVDGEVSNRRSTLYIGPQGAPVTLDAVWDGDTVTGKTWVLAGGDAGVGITGDRTIVAGSLETSMATKDGVSFQTERNTFPGDAWCDWNMGDAIRFDGVPAGATTLSLDLTYSTTVESWGPEDPDHCCYLWGGPDGDGVNLKTGTYINCCDSWGTLDPAWALAGGGTHTSEYSCTLGNSPMGWGLRVMSAPGGGLTWQDQWWDNTGTDTNNDGDDDIWALDGSGDKNLPADNDVQGGGEMYSHVGFTGDPATLTDYQWGTNHASNYITDDGSVIVVWCGGSWQFTNVDYAKLTVGFGAPPLF